MSEENKIESDVKDWTFPILLARLSIPLISACVKLAFANSIDSSSSSIFSFS